VLGDIGNQTQAPALFALDTTTGATKWSLISDGIVESLAYYEGTLYIGGAFDHIDGQERHSLAAIATNTHTVLPWNPGLFGLLPEEGVLDTVKALAVTASTVYAGGTFFNAPNDPSAKKNNLAAIDRSDGALTDKHPVADDMVETLAVDGTTVYVGGKFTALDNQSREYLASFDSAGAVTTWNPTMSNPVTELQIHAGKLYAAGNLAVFAQEVVTGGGEAAVPGTGLQYDELLANQGGLQFQPIDTVVAPPDQSCGDRANQPFKSGTLINDGGTIFLIMACQKIPFANMDSFGFLGYALKNVLKVDLSQYNLTRTPGIFTKDVAHTWGSWLSYNGTVYYSHHDGLIGVPDFNTFTAAGGHTKYILPANQYDIEIFNQNPGLPVLTIGDSRLIY
jgi:hypothetical protein